MRSHHARTWRGASWPLHAPARSYKKPAGACLGRFIRGADAGRFAGATPAVLSGPAPCDGGRSGPFPGALGVIRTPDPLLRKQVLYPLSYEGIFNCQAGREGFEPSVEVLAPTSA